jgi:hypothetical protein
MIGIKNGAKTMVYDAQSGERFFDVKAFGPFVAYPVAF